MKKLLVIILAVGLFAGCGETKKPEEPAKVENKGNQTVSREQQVERLIKQLQYKNSETRKMAAIALRKLGDKTAVSLLIKALENEDEDENVRSNAVEALGWIGGKSAVPALIKVLGHEKWSVRSNVAEALGRIGDKSAVPALINALGDKEMWGRSNAIEALGKIEAQTAVPALIKALEDKGEEMYIRSLATEALEKITGRKLGLNPTRWQRWWKANKARALKEAK